MYFKIVHTDTFSTFSKLPQLLAHGINKEIRKILSIGCFCFASCRIFRDPKFDTGSDTKQNAKH